ncbi:MAG: GGDEF domain-containing protein, partial [Anaerolineaceae bacterium]|nr:GGDEF domain-containing protein [Anaerolineaceae bacterium]
YHKPLSLLILDPDHFKAINDGYGHLAGDQVLVEMTRRCNAEIRETDIFGRFGGDEFIIILPETNLEDARLAAERIRKAINDQWISTNNGKIMMSISLGVTDLSEDHKDQNLNDLINRADVALYAAKRAGRNRITVL